MNTNAPNDGGVNLEAILKRLPRSLRGHIVAIIGEFLGTLSFIFFAFAGTQTANISSNDNAGTTVITTTSSKTPQQLLYISLSFGFSLAVNAWVFFRISGGLFNPAVTVGMVLIGAITIVRGILLFVTQIVGAIAGAYIVSALFTGGLNVDTTLSDTTSVAQGVLIEMLLTTLLVFTIFMLAAEKHTGNFIAPVGIGLALFIAEMVGVFWTGGSLNPARSLAPAIVSKSFHTTQWVYWVGPLAGSLLAVVIFKIIKSLEYETANPDPEAPSPTGPVVPAEAIVRHDSRRTVEADLESGFDASSKDKEERIPSRTDGRMTNGGSSNAIMNNISMDSSQQTGSRMENQRLAQSAPQTYPVIQAPPERGYNVQTTRDIPMQNLSSQSGASTLTDERWNAVHTANARNNTTVLPQSY